jgi:LysR family transcriptional regulator, low CO2-responsive transcriptional regulator
VGWSFEEARAVTPTQLRAYSAVARLGSVKLAAGELDVSEAAISLHVAKLRKELGDQLFGRTAAGLAFTPGGLRLASRAAEMLGLQDRTVWEVRQAGSGGRLLRIAASSMFAEHAAPGLIELFTGRASDLNVELSVDNPDRFSGLLHTRAVDVAIGPAPKGADESLVRQPFLNYQVFAVVAPEHRLARSRPGTGLLREQTWLLGPSATGEAGTVPTILRRLAVPERHQRIFQSHAAALEEAKRGSGVALALAFAVAPDLAAGRLVRLAVPQARAEGFWNTWTLPHRDAAGPAAELVRFVGTPRAIQAMLRGSGVNVGHFRPSIHVTLWS